jgi:F0F1-type ATP synthase assembly protein I
MPFPNLQRLPLKSSHCYTFAASQGRLHGKSALQAHCSGKPASCPKATRVHDPIAAGRRAAARAVAVQAAAVALVALAFLLQGPAHALAAGWGGLAMVAGNALAARVALRGIAAAGIAFGRLLLGALAKWTVALAGFAIGLGVWRLPSLPMLAGLATGLLAYLAALNLGGSKLGNRVERER